jgi:hypothetical protein
VGSTPLEHLRVDDFPEETPEKRIHTAHFNLVGKSPCAKWLTPVVVVVVVLPHQNRAALEADSYSSRANASGGRFGQVQHVGMWDGPNEPLLCVLPPAWAVHRRPSPVGRLHHRNLSPQVSCENS